jgi:chaperonin GroES
MSKGDGVRPLNDYVLVEVKVRKVTKGGIVVPDSAAAPGRCAGVVVGLPPRRGLLRRRGQVRMGETVLFGRNQGWAIDGVEKSYLAIHEKDLIAVVPAEPEGLEVLLESRIIKPGQDSVPLPVRQAANMLSGRKVGS